MVTLAAQHSDSFDRTPVAAGTFYPAQKERLMTLLASYFNALPATTKSNSTVAAIVPHAGYVYSGSVAAAAIAQIDPHRSYDHIFLIGSSHTHMFHGASIYSQGSYSTPLGKVNIDPLAETLLNECNLFNNRTEIHEREHALEVIIPFLQYWLKSPFTIIPIIIGGESEKVSREIAKALKKYFNDSNLFIISSDFSHYPQYEDAIMVDNLMAEAIKNGSPNLFLNTKRELENRKINQLLTVACGWTSILTLLYIIDSDPQYKISKILYRNSGDTKFGAKDRVVGYNAIAVFKKNGDTSLLQNIILSQEDKYNLIQIARKTLENYVLKKSKYKVSSEYITPNLKKNVGAFVTLKKEGELRGCIGTFKSNKPLYLVVRDMTISSAAFDYRFDAVEPEELKQIEIEISVLTPLKKVKNIDEINLGRHGIYIKKGNKSGTFLPQVANKSGWSKEEFLGHCARDKASIGWEGWKDANIYIFEANIFNESEFNT